MSGLRSGLLGPVAYCIDSGPVNLPRERHQRRVQRKRQQQVRRRHCGHGEDGNKVCDAPVVRNERGNGKDDHAGDEEAGE